MHASIGQKWGGGLYVGSLPLPMSNAMWAHNLCTFSGCLIGEINKVKHNMTSLLAVATDFIGLWTLIYCQGGGGGFMHETKLPMQELELKVQGCVIAGFYMIL